jgi:tripartite-type tricarboxylate transporter receptor subunit TctC
MDPRIPSSRRRFLAHAGAAAAALGLHGLALAEGDAWPAKPVKVICNFPPGSSPDALIRAVSQPLQQALGQSVVIDNRAGASGMIGADLVAKAPADGYTLLMSSGGTVSINPHLYNKMPFDPAKDLVPVAAAARVLVFLVIKPSLPPQNIKDFIAYVKERPGKLSYGSPGTGSSPHLAGEMFKSQAGLYALHVPYRGAAPALQDLLAGQLDFYFDPGIGLNQVRAGKLRLLAVGSPRRSPQFPDVPTLDEAGLKGFDADTVFGFYAPAGTPADVIARLNREINKVLGTQAVKDRVLALGGEALPLTPAEFNAKAMEDSKRFGAIIKERRILAD